MRFDDKVRIRYMSPDNPEAYGKVCNVNDDWITIIIETDILYKKNYSVHDLETLNDLPAFAKGTND